MILSRMGTYIRATQVLLDTSCISTDIGQRRSSFVGRRRVDVRGWRPTPDSEKSQDKDNLEDSWSSPMHERIHV